ncbi:DUF7217 family protein [Aeromonas hydrophila]|uniref:DUF7217 family protein n=1 Tax=Aeromonas hydrophila TaxID=644 RepID=UPI003D22862B
MLDSPKAQAVYRALQSSGGFSSPAGQKAETAISKSTDLAGQMDQMMKLPDEGIPPGGGLPTIVPNEIKDAVAKLEEYKGLLGGTTSTAQGLSGAIDQRMDNVTGNMARMSTAASVAEKMGDVPGGCGPLGAAFSVLTSDGRTDLLNLALDNLGVALKALGDLLTDGKGMNTENLPEPLKSMLAAAMAAVDAIMGEVGSATDSIKGLVDEAQAMWAKLDTVFTEAVQSSILMSMVNNPCMMAVVESVSPPEVIDVLDAFE